MNTELIISIIIAIPLSAVFLYKILKNGEHPSYTEWNVTREAEEKNPLKI